MSDKEKIEALEREVKLLREIIELQDKLMAKEITYVPYIPYYPPVTYPPYIPYSPWSVTYAGTSGTAGVADGITTYN